MDGRYDLMVSHFHCNGCGTTFCVEALQLPQAPKVKGARVEQVYLVLEGKCAECK
jgi:Fur family transcriptional regulator, ferric uptake regulator